MRLEETAIEERSRAESEGGPPPLGDWTVERSEEQRSQEVTVDALSLRQAPVHLLAHESLSAGQPTLGLHEIEK